MDLIRIIQTYPIDEHIEPVSQDEVNKLIKHYNNFMYQALLHCTKNSLNAIKTRLGSRLGFGGVHIEQPMFQVTLQLSIPTVVLKPTLDNVQDAINQAAKAVLECARTLWDWGQDSVPPEHRVNFYDRVTQDIEIVRVCLLLTGSVQGTRNSVMDHLGTFNRFDWMWKQNADESYKEFTESQPGLDDYEQKLSFFVKVFHAVVRYLSKLKHALIIHHGDFRLFIGPS